MSTRKKSVTITRPLEVLGEVLSSGQLRLTLTTRVRAEHTTSVVGMPMPEVLAFHYTLPLWDPDGREIVLKEFLDHLDAVVTHLAP